MLGPLAFIAVREQADQAAMTLPFGLRGGDELIEQHLCAVREIAELRFPQDEHARIGQRVAVFEANAGVFSQGTVMNAEAGLPLVDCVQGRERLAIRLVKQHRMSVAKSAALDILSCEADGMTFDQQRAI